MIEFWRYPQMFDGETVFVVGCGPSLADFDFDRLRGRHVIVCKRAGHDVPWADILMFQDDWWPDLEPELVASFAGEVATFNKQGAKKHPRIRWLEACRWPMTRGGPVRIGPSTGHTAVGLAVSAGAARVVLLGFDMRLVDGVAHYRGETPEHNPLVYAESFLPAWRGWREQAAELGCTIVNATPGSALDEFEHMSIDEELA